MFLFSKANNAVKRNHGFTLLEVALALIVISLVMVPYIQVYKQYMNDQIKEQSDDYISVIQSALQKYAMRYGRYPMPANPSLGPGSAAGFGQEVALATIGNCSAASLAACRTTAAWGVVPNNTVLIGAVPFAALGLPQKYNLDGYNNKFTYAVTESLTVAASYKDNGGIIQVIDELGSETQGTNKNAHYVIVSHGSDRKGAFTLNGIQTITCDLSILSRDNDNCDNNATFRSNFATIGTGGNAKYTRDEIDVAGPNHYDDYIHWATSTDTDIWTKTVASGTTSDIFNRDLGSIRVGGTTEPTAKVEVRGGDFKATAFRADRLCTNTGICAAAGSTSGLAVPYNYAPNVFSPSIIAADHNSANNAKPGGGIDCGPNTGLTGIGNSDEECNLSDFPTSYSIGTSCSTGMAAHKIVGGKLVCVIPDVK
jgi:prepilin-type N-terminal cleavage/methylation domain-containing protein